MNAATTPSQAAARGARNPYASPNSSPLSPSPVSSGISTPYGPGSPIPYQRPDAHNYRHSVDSSHNRSRSQQPYQQQYPHPYQQQYPQPYQQQQQQQHYPQPYQQMPSTTAGRSSSPHRQSNRSSNPKKQHTSVFGPYMLGKTLGEGEFGKVKLGHHLDTRREVAVKLIRKESIDSPARREKLIREISLLKSVSHPHIVKLHEVIETEHYIGMIMDYASGGERGFPHKNHIVHRDLKLENLLIDEHRNIVITDFGFANTFTSDTSKLLQTSCGSPCYAAPELVISDGYVGETADIWSCGVILYAMVCGYLPYDDDPTNPEGDNINLLYKYILETQPDYPEYVSDSARHLISTILVPDPSRRATMAQIKAHKWLLPYSHIFRDATPQNTKMDPDVLPLGSLSQVAGCQSTQSIQVTVNTVSPLPFIECAFTNFVHFKDPIAKSHLAELTRSSTRVSYSRARTIVSRQSRHQQQRTAHNNSPTATKTMNSSRPMALSTSNNISATSLTNRSSMHHSVNRIGQSKNGFAAYTPMVPAARISNHHTPAMSLDLLNTPTPTSRLLLTNSSVGRGVSTAQQSFPTNSRDYMVSAPSHQSKGFYTRPTHPGLGVESPFTSGVAKESLQMDIIRQKEVNRPVARSFFTPVPKPQSRTIAIPTDVTPNFLFEDPLLRGQLSQVSSKALTAEEYAKYKSKVEESIGFMDYQDDSRVEKTLPTTISGTRKRHLLLKEEQVHDPLAAEVRKLAKVRKSKLARANGSRSTRRTGDSKRTPLRSTARVRLVEHENNLPAESDTTPRKSSQKTLSSTTLLKSALKRRSTDDSTKQECTDDTSLTLESDAKYTRLSSATPQSSKRKVSYGLFDDDDNDRYPDDPNDKWKTSSEMRPEDGWITPATRKAGKPSRWNPTNLLMRSQPIAFKGILDDDEADVAAIRMVRASKVMGNSYISSPTGSVLPSPDARAGLAAGLTEHHLLQILQSLQLLLLR
ncbi:hypothetical protein BASA81_009900 [Batrachochytrium salamandrivorans]|nr:hypothetical protein BASA81_009900 [Batrachochytrium salamandrivorans]